MVKIVELNLDIAFHSCRINIIIRYLKIQSWPKVGYILCKIYLLTRNVMYFWP